MGASLFYTMANFTQAIRWINEGKCVRRDAWEPNEYIDCIPHSKLTAHEAKQEDWEVIFNPQTAI